MSFEQNEERKWAPTKRLADLEGKEWKGNQKCHKVRCEYFGFFLVYLTFIPSEDLWVQVNRNKLVIDKFKTRFFSFSYEATMFLVLPS